MFAPALVPLFFILSACTFRTPLLDPETKKFEKGEAITVSVRQVTTEIGAEDRKRFGVDLSAYYTPVLVTLLNRSDFSAALNPFEARLTVVSQEGKESIYPPGGNEEGVIIFKKIHATACGEAVLSLPRISVLNQEKEFTFGFSCRK